MKRVLESSYENLAMDTSDTVQDLVDLLHIDVVELIESRHDRIREGYETPLVAEDFEEFKRITVEYVRYHHKHWVGTDIGTERAWGQVREALDEISPAEQSLSRHRSFLDVQGDYVQAIKNSLTGHHGGLISVVDVLAGTIKRKAVQHWIQSIFLSGVDALGHDRRVAFAREYLDRYGHLLPAGEEAISVHELARQLETLMEIHLKVINELRNLLH